MPDENVLNRHADTAYQSIRRINHLTIAGPALPAPTLYPVLGALTQLQHGLDQALGQLAHALQRSPDFYALYEANPGRTPEESIAEAVEWLSQAAQHARECGHALSEAHTAIAGQGWHSKAGDRAVDERDGTDR